MTVHVRPPRHRGGLLVLCGLLAAACGGETTAPPSPAPVASVSIAGPTTSLQVGTTLQLSAILKDSAGGVLADRAVAWSSRSEDIATVSSTGLVSGLAAGSAVIVATSEGKQGTTTLHVTAPPPAGTDVAGPITSSATWTKAASPYRLTGNVQVNAGVTLTIEPGASVIGNDQVLAVAGTLAAVGTAADSIAFSGVKLQTAVDFTANAYLVHIEYAKVTGGEMLPATGHSASGAVILRHSRLTDVGTAQYRHTALFYTTADSYVEQNAFVHSGGISVFPQGAAVYIRNNRFEDQMGGFAVNSLATATSLLVVTGNSFMTTTKVAARIEPGTNRVLDASNNFWNTTDPGVIQAMVYDDQDDAGIASSVTVDPVLTAPAPETPAN